MKNLSVLGLLLTLLIAMANIIFAAELPTNGKVERVRNIMAKASSCFTNKPAIKQLLEQGITRYDGPNCFNAALIASGVMSSDLVRYVSLAEFKEELAYYFKPYSSCLYNYNERSGKRLLRLLGQGDLLVISSVEHVQDFDHVVHYLGEGYVFHKKGYEKKYPYEFYHLDDFLKDRQKSGDECFCFTIFKRKVEVAPKIGVRGDRIEECLARIEQKILEISEDSEAVFRLSFPLKKVLGLISKDQVLSRLQKARVESFRDQLSTLACSKFYLEGTGFNNPFGARVATRMDASCDMKRPFIQDLLALLRDPKERARCKPLSCLQSINRTIYRAAQRNLLNPNFATISFVTKLVFAPRD